MSDDVKKRFISWIEIENLAQITADKVRFSGWQPDIVVGLTRGGLVPAVMISHILKCEMTALDINQNPNSLVGIQDSWLPTDGLSWEYKLLIVDDINDTGHTFNFVRKRWLHSMRDGRSNKIEWPDSLFKFAALLHNDPSSAPTDFCGDYINKNIDPEWIVFPWEK